MVLQVVPALESGGVERGTVDVAAAIQAAGGTAIVASRGGGLMRELPRAGAIHVTLPLSSKNPLVMWANVGRLVKVIERYGVDIVHARSRAPAWSAYYAARRAGVPFMTTFHGTYNQQSALKRRYNSIMTKGERVIAISQFISRHVRDVYGVEEARVRVIPRGVDLDMFDPDRVSAERLIQLARKWRLTEAEAVILLPGRLVRWKGHAVLIAAVAGIHRRNLRCIFVGRDQGHRGYRAELEAKARALGVDGAIQFGGECRDMPAAYKLADVVVSASTDPEAFGRVIAEAMAMGRPVVASNHGGAAEQLTHGETGFLVEPGDSTALALAIDRALSLDGARRAALGVAARADARRRFAKEAMCRSTLAVYEELLAARAPVGAPALAPT